jgi:hypothetical protein
MERDDLTPPFVPGCDEISLGYRAVSFHISPPPTTGPAIPEEKNTGIEPPPKPPHVCRRYAEGRPSGCCRGGAPSDLPDHAYRTAVMVAPRTPGLLGSIEVLLHREGERGRERVSLLGTILTEGGPESKECR